MRHQNHILHSNDNKDMLRCDCTALWLQVGDERQTYEKCTNNAVELCNGRRIGRV